MKKIFILLFLTLGAGSLFAMLPLAPRTAEQNIAIELEISNKTNHNLFISDALNNEKVIMKLRAGQTNKQTARLPVMNPSEPEKYYLSYSIHSMKEGEQRQIGHIRIGSYYDKKNGVIQTLSVVLTSFLDGGMKDLDTDYFYFEGLKTPLSYGAKIKIILEGDDLNKSRIEDLTGVIH